MTQKERLGVGFIGSGFITRFHVRSWVAVRDADVRGVWSPNRERAEEAAALARSLRVGEAKAFSSIEEMVSAPEIDCVWVCGPNHARVENMERITAARGRGADLVGIACEKPLARNAGEARRVVFHLDPSQLAFVGPRLRWRVEPGRFAVQVGASSEDVRAEGSLEIVGGVRELHCAEIVPTRTSLLPG